MNAVSKLAVFSVFAFFAHSAMAGGGSYRGHDSITDGSAAARAGTTLHNTLRPNNPLPLHGGNGEVVRQTITNMGAGQSVKNAWSNAAQSAAGAGSTPRKKD